MAGKKTIMKRIKEDRKILAILLGMVVISFFIGGMFLSGQDVDRPVTNYGDWYLYDPLSVIPIVDGAIIKAADGLKVTFVLDSQDYKPDYLNCKLYKAVTPWEFVEEGEGGWQTSAYIWYFNLDATSTGVNSYFIGFSGEDGNWFVSGETFTFQIDNEEVPVYNNPVILERPDDAYFDLMEAPSKVEWKYISYSSSVITITVNDVIVEDQPAGLDGVENFFIYDVDTSAEGTQNIVFMITPLTDNPAVSDTVVITIEESATTTTTTTTTTTPPTTTTTPPPPIPTPPPDEEMIIVYVVGGVVVLGLVWAIVKGSADSKKAKGGH